MPETVTQSWLNLQCRMIPNASAGVAVFDAGDSGGVVPAAAWPNNSAPVEELVQVARLAFDRASTVMLDSTSGDSPAPAGAVDIALPLLTGNGPPGAVAVRMKSVAGDHSRTVLQLLQWGAAWLDLLRQGRAQGGTGTEPIVSDCLDAVLTRDGLRKSATALAGVLAERLSCECVSVGLSTRGRVRVEATSHSASFESRSNLLQCVRDAMEEAVVARRSLGIPSPAPDQSHDAEAHARLAEEAEGASLCTVPFPGGNGALTLERAGTRPFRENEIRLSEVVAASCGPVLALRQESERSLPGRLLQALTRPVRRVVGPGTPVLKAAAVGIGALVAVLVLVEGEYRVKGTATLEGTVQRAVVAPFRGFVADARARAGESVHAGQVLAALDDRDLQMQVRKWRGQHQELAKEYRKALAALDHAQARILRAKIVQTEAQLELLEQQLERTQLLAPFDGVIISGDLSRSLGAPVERGDVLFEVAPLDAYRVVMEVDERDIPDVTPGQEGELTLAALPGEALALLVENVSTIAGEGEGPATFRVEGRLLGERDRLRPGMRGVGKIQVGSRGLLWIWTRRLVGWVRLTAWSWLP